MMVIQTYLAEGNHFWRREQAFKLPELRQARISGIMWLNAHGSIDLWMETCQLHTRRARGKVVAHIDQPPHTGVERMLKDHVAVRVIRGNMQMRMRIDQVHLRILPRGDRGQGTGDRE